VFKSQKGKYAGGFRKNLTTNSHEWNELHEWGHHGWGWECTILWKGCFPDKSGQAGRCTPSEWKKLFLFVGFRRSPFQETP